MLYEFAYRLTGDLIFLLSHFLINAEKNEDDDEISCIRSERLYLN